MAIERFQVGVTSIESEIETSSTGDVEILIPHPGGTYQLVWERSYGKGVFNPDDQIEDLVTGRTQIQRGRRKLLFGTHLNGACPADCKGCPFGRSVMRKHKVLARPIEPEELKLALGQAVQIGVHMKLVQPDEEFSAGALLSGDPGYSHFTAGLIEVVSNFPGCRSSRWSTIAPADGDVFGEFEKGAQNAAREHSLFFQTSLHSSNEENRKIHTGVKRLLSVSAISDAARRLLDITGRKMTMAFVLHEGSDIDPVQLRDQIPAAIASLRPMKSDNYQPMGQSGQIEMYRKFRDAGWDVVYMPVSPDALELDNMADRDFK